MSQDSSLKTSPSLLGRLRDSPDDQSAWTEFVRRYQPRLLAWCRRWGLQDSDAQEVAKNVMLRLASKLRVLSYDPSLSFRGWLHTIARHAWSDFVTDRRKQAVEGDPSDVLESAQAREDLEQRLAEVFDLELLEEATSRVKARVEEKTWEAFRRMAMLEEPAAVVSAALSMPIASVFKARSNIQKMLQEEISSLERPASVLP
jgi:RNA polymerase sigma-70 factor (ECF subfamily)